MYYFISLLKKRDAPKKEEIKCIIYKKKKEKNFVEAIFLNIRQILSNIFGRSQIYRFSNTKCTPITSIHISTLFKHIM